MTPLIAAMLSIMLAAGPDDVGLSIKRQAAPGEKPAFVIIPRKPVLDGLVALKRDDGKILRFKVPKLKADERKEFSVEQGPGKHAYDATITLRFAESPKEPLVLTVPFDAVVIETPRLRLKQGSMDLEQRRAELTLDHPARDIRVTVIGAEKGDVVEESLVTFESVPAGEPLPVTWKAAEKVLRVEFLAHTTDDLHSDILEVTPFSLAIAHEDVEFPTGQSAIPKEEQPKIDAALKEIQAAVGKYGKVVSIRLFVVGHTDTVGDSASNRTLSEARALAIARAFRASGLRIPILYQGAGEDRLRVATPDEVDDKRNRRVEYIIAVDEPANAARAWKQL